MLMNFKCAFVYLFELFISPQANKHNATCKSILNFNLLRGCSRMQNDNNENDTRVYECMWASNQND